MLVAENMEKHNKHRFIKKKNPPCCSLTKFQVGALCAAPGSLKKMEMDFMKHISDEKLPSFCPGDPWQPGLAHTKGKADK